MVTGTIVTAAIILGVALAIFVLAAIWMHFEEVAEERYEEEMERKRNARLQ